MDSIVKAVAQKTGLSQEMSEKVVEVVLEQVAQRLPAPYSTQLTAMITAHKAKNQVGKQLKGIGSLFGM